MTSTTLSDDRNRVNGNESHLVDKTGFIEGVLSKRMSDALLFCRPFGFGKTTNLTMLDVFLNMEHRGNGRFEGTEISETGRFDGYRNSFPVVRLDMKSVCTGGGQDLNEGLGKLVRDAYLAHRRLFESDRVSDLDRTIFRDVVSRDPAAYDPEDLMLLTDLLHQHHEVGAVVLIDDYDAPVRGTIGMPEHGRAVDALSRLFSPLLKDNPHLFKAVLTGVFRIGGRLSTGLNNLNVSTVLDQKGFADSFGFTDDDVTGICVEAGHPEAGDAVLAGCGGYTLDGMRICDPRAVTGFFDKDSGLSAFQVPASIDRLLRSIMFSGDSDIRECINALLAGKSVGADRSLLFEYIPEGPVSEMGPDELLSLMLQSGHLTSSDTEDGLELRVPNERVMRTLREWSVHERV